MSGINSLRSILNFLITPSEPQPTGLKKVHGNSTERVEQIKNAVMSKQAEERESAIRTEMKINGMTREEAEKKFDALS